MFRNDQQRAEAIFYMLPPHMRARYWDRSRGPTDDAWTAIATEPMSGGEATILRAACDFWNGGGRALLDNILHGLDGRNTHAVCSLAIAVNEGGEAVEAWIAGRIAREDLAVRVAPFVVGRQR